MKKDVIYIDIEDDITAIIEKVKAATAKIVALVPPKRTGVLQSAVNLKLLKKSAAEDDKRVVLITNDQSLISLAAGVKLPVARNLQSKPEIPPVPALQIDDDDIINGEELPVGEIAEAAGVGAMVQKGAEAPTAADEISKHVDFGAPTPSVADTKAAQKKAGAGAVSGLAKKIKVPNFNTFRKKLFLIGGGTILLVIFLIWALAIAPSATIVINAKTTAVNIDRVLTLAPGLQQSKLNELQLKPNVQQIKKSNAQEFDATGTKDVGEKASGKVTLTNSFDSSPVNVPAGTVFTAASGQRFTSSAGVTVPGASVSGGGIKPGSASVVITATDLGPEYNIAAQSYSVQGYSNLGASGEQMSGGTREKVTVVSQEDVDKAKEKLTQQDANAVKADLKKQFNGDFIIIDESFSADAAAPSVAPKVGEQAKKAKVTIETTYTLLGLPRGEVKQILSDALKDTVDNKPNQSVFSDGSNTISFQDFQKVSGGNYAAKMVTTGYIGTTIDTAKLADQLKGKRYGEIEQIVNAIPGVNKVDIQFSPFWVTSAPGSADKITIRFTVVNDTN